MINCGLLQDSRLAEGSLKIRYDWPWIPQNPTIPAVFIYLLKKKLLKLLSGSLWISGDPDSHQTTFRILSDSLAAVRNLKSLKNSKKNCLNDNPEKKGGGGRWQGGDEA